MRTFLAPVLALLLVSACSSSTTSPDVSPTEGQASASAPGPASPSATPDETSASPTAPPGPPVDIVVVVTSPGEVIQDLLDQGIGGDDMCRVTLDVDRDTNGATIELTLPSDPSFTPIQLKLRPSKTNKETLPCTKRAVFKGVPANAAQYQVTRVGGPYPYSTTATWDELVANDFTMTVG